jgi:hypothetical protein
MSAAKSGDGVVVVAERLTNHREEHHRATRKRETA